MDRAPVADQGEHQQQHGDNEQSGRLRRVDVVTVVYVFVGLVGGGGHGLIVALRTARRNAQETLGSAGGSTF